MPDPGAISDSVGGMFSSMFNSGSQQYMVYVGYAVWAIILLAVGFFFYYMLMYKYKVTIFEGSIETNKDRTKFRMNIRKVTRDRAMPTKENGLAKWRLLMNFGKKIEPIDYKYIQPGNHVFLFKTGPDTFNPMPLKAGNPSASFNVDPFDQAFLNLGVQNDAREYMKDDAVKKAQIWMFVSGIIILVAIVLSGWLILKYSAHTAEKIEFAGNALRGIAGGIAPN